MKLTATQLAQILAVFTGRLSQESLQAITDAEQELEDAAAHHGMNSQMKANIKRIDAHEKAIDDMGSFYQDEISLRIEQILSTN